MLLFVISSLWTLPSPFDKQSDFPQLFVCQGEKETRRHDQHLQGPSHPTMGPEDVSFQGEWQRQYKVMTGEVDDVAVLADLRFFLIGAFFSVPGAGGGVALEAGLGRIISVEDLRGGAASGLDRGTTSFVAPTANNKPFTTRPCRSRRANPECIGLCGAMPPWRMGGGTP